MQYEIKYKLKRLILNVSQKIGTDSILNVISKRLE
jgi:hypothetical protein